MSRRVFLALASEPQETLLRAALGAHDIAVDTLPLGAHLETALQQAMRATEPPLLVIDLPVLAQLKTCATAFCAWKREHCANTELLLYCSSLHAVHAQARTWAQRMGARDLLPGCELSHWRTSLLPALGTLLEALGVGAPDEAATARALQSLPALLDHDSAVAHAWRQHDLLCRLGATPEALVAALGGRLAMATRRYRTRAYEECCVGTELVNGLCDVAKAADAPHAREDVLPVGQALLELGYLYHVVREQPLRDGNFYYRLRAQSPRLDALDLCAVVEQWRGAVPIRDRRYRGVVYPRCFTGSEAVAWMRRALALNENEVMTLGERLLELSVFHHVFDEHHFCNRPLFYRFYQDEA